MSDYKTFEDISATADVIELEDFIKVKDSPIAGYVIREIKRGGVPIWEINYRGDARPIPKDKGKLVYKNYEWAKRAADLLALYEDAKDDDPDCPTEEQYDQIDTWFYVNNLLNPDM